MQADAIPPRPQPAVRALNCPSCGSAVTLRAAGYSVTVGCPSCGSILDVNDAAVKLITEYHEMAAGLDIPLGTRGTYDGIEWEVIGHLDRSIYGAWPWEEYLLFNPYYGYRWLVTDGQSWSFGELLTMTPGYLTYDTLCIGDMEFRRFFAEREVQVDRVIGEFYWRVAAGERVASAEWAGPGWMLSRESNANEVSWTLLKLLTPAEMAEFGVSGVPRRPWPPPPHMVSPHRAWLGTGLKVAGAALGFLLLLMVFFAGGRWSDAGWFPVSAGVTGEQTVTIGPLRFDRPYQRVEIRAEVPRLENGWLDLDYSLVNRADQKVYEAYGAAERYNGVDSDGAWSEGSRASQVSMASVPRGEYDLIVEYRGNKWDGGYQQTFDGWMDAGNAPRVGILVRTGGLYGANLIVAAILLLLPLLWGLFRHVRFEQARQGESDFDPTGAAALFRTSEDEED
ncbi:DUF4178 domain-containing protein [Sphingomonas canadensis]|uniref:DUF4178 domain-containing protein n=1 Tax=Sphingomonas canadensis TaxID=1219257 RepID=A0ABW3HBS4_9SPHN|nr:DUF4178 domain-containing protein [Sphingomonas canadensis]MCW3838257.1 DUF4178 domain-containing protein [Sphingomonas canadensis]